MVSYVTAFLLQDCDRENTQKIESYMTRFKSLSDLPIQIIVFLDEQLDIPAQPNLHIIKTSLKDTQIYKEYYGLEPILPPKRSPAKDTATYMMIQNAKNEFMYRASTLDPFSTDHFIWIDFGITYILRQPATSLACLTAVSPSAGKVPKGNLFAGINAGSHNQLFDQICWRFAGGCYIMDKERAALMYDAYLAAIKEVKPAITWEVNMWAWLERNGRFDFDTYYGNHDDTMLTNLPHAS